MNMLQLVVSTTIVFILVTILIKIINVTSEYRQYVKMRRLIPITDKELSRIIIGIRVKCKSMGPKPIDFDKELDDCVTEIYKKYNTKFFFIPNGRNFLVGVYGSAIDKELPPKGREKRQYPRWALFGMWMGKYYPEFLFEHAKRNK